MRYRLQRHDGTDCSATMVPITVLRMVPIQRYRHHYDAANRLTQKEAWKWNVDAQAYERYYCLNYHYADDEVTMEYALWNEKTHAFDAAKEKAVYQLEAGNVNYFAFEWNRHLQDWNLMVSHDTWAAQEVQLLAEK